MVVEIDHHGWDKEVVVEIDLIGWKKEVAIEIDGTNVEKATKVTVEAIMPKTLKKDSLDTDVSLKINHKKHQVKSMEPNSNKCSKTWWKNL